MLKLVYWRMKLSGKVYHSINSLLLIVKFSEHFFMTGIQTLSIYYFINKGLSNNIVSVAWGRCQANANFF